MEVLWTDKFGEGKDEHSCQKCMNGYSLLFL